MLFYILAAQWFSKQLNFLFFQICSLKENLFQGLFKNRLWNEACMVLFVVYFDHRTGDPHAVCWSKSFLLLLLLFFFIQRNNSSLARIWTPALHGTGYEAGGLPIGHRASFIVQNYIIVQGTKNICKYNNGLSNHAFFPHPHNITTHIIHPYTHAPQHAPPIHQPMHHPCTDPCTAQLAHQSQSQSRSW